MNPVDRLRQLEKNATEGPWTAMQDAVVEDLHLGAVTTGEIRYPDGGGNYGLSNENAVLQQVALEIDATDPLAPRLSSALSNLNEAIEKELSE